MRVRFTAGHVIIAVACVAVVAAVLIVVYDQRMRLHQLAVMHQAMADRAMTERAMAERAMGGALRAQALVNAEPGGGPESSPGALGSRQDELERLRRENAELRSRVERLEHALKLSGDGPSTPAASNP